jgi:hypothetical protein
MAMPRTAAPLGSWTIRTICRRLLQPTGRFQRLSMSLVVTPATEKNAPITSPKLADVILIRAFYSVAAKIFLKHSRFLILWNHNA